MRVQISAGQSLVDVCLQELGTVEALFELADANGLTITAALRPGQLLTVPESISGRPDVVSYFAGRQQRINVPDPVRAAAGPVEPPEPPTPATFFHPDFFTTEHYG